MQQNTLLTNLNNENIDPYQNGQSDVEKLMRRHLQTPNDVITDEELKNLRVGTEGMPATSALVTNNREEENSETDEEKPVTPWDVLDA